MDEDIHEAEVLEELEELEDFDLENNNASENNLPSDGCTVVRDFDAPRLIRNLEFSKIPAIVIDSRLNILWQNNSYSDLFKPGNRILPVNLVSDFSSFLTPERIGEIHRSITNPGEGYSFKGKIEFHDRQRLSIIANIMVNPYFHNKDKIEVDAVPDFYTVFFDDITWENKQLLQRTFMSLLQASKLKDNDTGNHIDRVGEYSKELAGELFSSSDYTQVNKEFVENIRFLAPMHDVGKIGTPDDILNKTSALDSHEWNIMKEHTINGAYILKAYPDPMATQIATFHHEKWNGKGYPYGISGKDIPLPARIVSLADVYDALRMKRSYKKAFSHEEAIKIIVNDSGTHFDPNLVEVFLKIQNRIRDIYERLKDS